MTNLDSILESRDITLPTKVRPVKAMVFPVVTYGLDYKESCVCLLVTQSCLPLCDPMNCSPPGFSVRGILQARILEWVDISFSKGSSWLGDQICVSCIGRQILYHWAIREAPCMLTYGLWQLEAIRVQEPCWNPLWSPTSQRGGGGARVDPLRHKRELSSKAF